MTASEGEHEPKEVHAKDAPQASDSTRAGLTVADADSKLYYRDLPAVDMGQTRAQRLAAAFVQNTKLLAYLTYRIDYLQQSEKFKRRVDLQQQVTRLAMIRKDTSYNVAVMAFMRPRTGCWRPRWVRKRGLRLVSEGAAENGEGEAQEGPTEARHLGDELAGLGPPRRARPRGPV